jgi:hypothetical protein
MRQPVGILADDDVSLFEAQYALRLNAEGLNAESLPGIDKPVPHLGAKARKAMDFVAERSDKADGQDAHGYPGAI